VGKNIRSVRQLILLSSHENMHVRDDPFKLLHSAFTVSFGETATELTYSTARAAAMTRKVGPNEGGTFSGVGPAADCKDSVMYVRRVVAHEIRKSDIAVCARKLAFQDNHALPVVLTFSNMHKHLLHSTL
jgi:hypothetical protein